MSFWRQQAVVLIAIEMLAQKEIFQEVAIAVGYESVSPSLKCSDDAGSHTQTYFEAGQELGQK